MTHRDGLTRRDLGLLAANLGVVSLAGSLMTLGRSARAQEAAKVTLGHFSSANQQNFSKATGSMQKAMGAKAQVEYVGVTTGPQVLTAMAGNSIDLCNVGSSPMVVAMSQGLPVSMVYVHKVIKDDESLIVRPDAGIRTVADLKGKKIGCPFNSSAHFALLAAMRSANLTAADVQLINLKPDAVLSAWQRKDIDGAYIWFPVAPKLLADGGTMIFNGSNLIPLGTVIFDAIVVRDEFKRQHPELVLAYLKELNRINTLYREHPEQMADVMAPFLQIERDMALRVARTTYTISPQEMLTETWMGAPGSKNSGVQKTLRDQAEFLKAADQIKAAPSDFDKFIDRSFVQKMV